LALRSATSYITGVAGSAGIVLTAAGNTGISHRNRVIMPLVSAVTAICRADSSRATAGIARLGSSWFRTGAVTVINQLIIA